MTVNTLAVLKQYNALKKLKRLSKLRSLKWCYLIGTYCEQLNCLFFIYLLSLLD